MSRSLARSRVEDLRRQLGATNVVLEEGGAPLGADRVGERLGDVVQQRAEAQRLPAGELVGQRLVQHRRQRRGLLTEDGRRIALEVDRRLQRGERVAVDIEVVVIALLQAAQRVELGQHHRGRADALGQLERRHGTVADEHQPQLG